MKFYDFLNEMARVNAKSMSPEEIAKTLIENKDGNIEEALKYANQIRRKFRREGNTELFMKMSSVISILENRSKSSAGESSHKKEDSSNTMSPKERAKSIFTNFNESLGYSYITRRMGDAKTTEHLKYWTDVMKEWQFLVSENKKQKFGQYTVEEQVDFYLKFTNDQRDFNYYCSNIRSNRAASTKEEYRKFWTDVLNLYKQKYEERTSKDKYSDRNKSYYDTQKEDNAWFSKVNNVTFCLTGKGPYPREHIEENIREAGGRINTIKYCDVLVCSDINSTVFKMRYAKAHGLKIITYNDLYKVINQNPFGDKKEKTQKTSNASRPWTMDDVYTEVNYYITKTQNDLGAKQWERSIGASIKQAMNDNDMNMYTYWSEVLRTYQLKWAEKKAEQDRKQKEQERKNQQSASFTSQQKTKVKELILKGVAPIPKGEFSYRKLLMKIHPDFHQNGDHEIATEMMKLVNANRDNLAVLRQYARDWKLLSENQKIDDIYAFLVEALNKY